MTIRKSTDVDPSVQTRRVRRNPVEQAPVPQVEVKKSETAAPKTVTATPESIQAEQRKSTVVDRDVRQNLEASVGTVSGEEASKTRLDNQQAILDGKKGERIGNATLQPEYKAAVDLARAFAPDVGAAVDGKLRQKAPGLAAAKDAMSGPTSQMIEGTMAQLASNPEALAALTQTVNLLGKEGFKEAMKASSGHVAEAFTKATGTALMDPEATTAALLKFPKLVGKLAPGKAAAATQLATKIGARLGLATNMAKTAQVATQGAEAAAQAGVAGAKVAGAGAQAVPGVNVALGLATTTMSLASLGKEVFRKPRSGLRIAAEAVNTLLQGAGILFPFVGAGATVAKLGVDKLIDHHEQKKGIERGSTESFDKAASAMPAVHQSLEALESVFAGAENPDAAKRMQGLRAHAKVFEEALKGAKDEEFDSPELKKARSEYLATAFGSFRDELQVAAGEAKGPEKEALLSAANGFGKLFTVLKKHDVLTRPKRLPGQEAPSAKDEESKRKLLQADVVSVLKDTMISVASQIAAAKQQGVPPPQVDAAA